MWVVLRDCCRCCGGGFVPGSARMYLFDDWLRAPDIARFIDSYHKVLITRSPHRLKDNCPRYLLPISYSQITHHGKSLASCSIQIWNQKSTLNRIVFVRPVALALSTPPNIITDYIHKLQVSSAAIRISSTLMPAFISPVLTAIPRPLYIPPYQPPFLQHRSFHIPTSATHSGQQDYLSLLFLP